MTQQSTEPSKRDLLAKLLLQQKKSAYNSPLSYGQQALWFIYQNAPDSPAYNMALALKLEGDLELSALQSALQSLVDRHSNLQSTIDFIDGKPVQTVKPIGTYDWKEHQAIDWSEQQLWSSLKSTYEEPFDLTKGPVLRANLFQTASQSYILLLTMHHIMGDASSMNILANELLLLYQAEITGQKTTLPALSTSYADFVQTEIELLNSITGEELLQYWQRQLGDESPVLNLPIDYSRPAVQTYNGASVPFCLHETLSRQLKQLAKQEKTTLFSFLLTAWQILLYRYTGQTEIWIGSPTSTSRRQPQFANLVGYLVNPVVLRATIEPGANLSFRELLSQTKQTVLEAIAHSTYPFPLLVKALQPQRDLSHAPLFQVMIDFQPPGASLVQHNIPDFKISYLDFPQMEGQFDLTLSLSEGEQLKGELRYNRNLFKAETIERMMGHFEVLLSAIIENSEQSFGRLPILTQTETQQLIAWNQTATDYPQDKTIVDLFESQVEKTPDNIAVIFEAQQLSYRELNHQSNQLAYTLIEMGVQTDTLVGICVERSLEMIIGLLGILKAGGAYVPLDPEYPQERLRFMLEDSQVPVLLTQNQFKGLLPELQAEVVCLDDLEELQNPLNTNPERRCRPESLSHVLFTSGSTGRPKGVMIEHSSAIALINWSTTTFENTYFQGTLASTSINFDLSIYEIFVPLSIGGQIILAGNVLHLPDLPHKDKVTLINTVPSAIAELLRTQAVPESVRLVCLAGEPLKNQIVQALYERPHVKAVYNLYGPSEDTTYSTFVLTQRGSKIEPNIGKPIADTQIYILDSSHQPQPISIPGELCIAGAGLARGYLNRSDLTAEKFIEAELFGQTQRIYKTGDLARWLPDGNIEYLGRIDHQVKLRGFRIELGEIETVLSQHEAIKEAVVILHEHQGNKTLAAYLTIETEADELTINHSQLTVDFRDYLKKRLPSYMIPSGFTILEQLPLTPNGKIDRKALPSLNFRKNSSVVYPRDAVELRLVYLWERLLNISPISVLDDFFESGGDSLIAIRLIFVINQEFSTRIPIHELFENRTIEKLACLLRQNSISSTYSPLICLQGQGTKIPFFFVHSAGGSAFDSLEMAKLMGSERPFYAFHPKGIERGESFHTSIEEMAADYAAALRNTQPKGPYLLGGWSFGGLVIFEMARILEQKGEKVSLLIMIDPPEPSDFTYKEDDMEFLMDRLPYFHQNLDLDNMEIQKSNEARLIYVFQEMKLAGLFAPDIDQEYARHWLNLYKHHNKIISLYKLSGKINGKVLFFKPTEKIPFDVQMGNPIPAFKKFLQGGIEVHQAPGNHFTLVSPINTPILVQKIKNRIENL